MTKRDWTATALEVTRGYYSAEPVASAPPIEVPIAAALAAAYAAGQADKEAEAEKWREEARREIEHLRYRIDQWRALSNGAKHPHDD